MSLWDQTKKLQQLVDEIAESTQTRNDLLSIQDLNLAVTKLNDTISRLTTTRDQCISQSHSLLNSKLPIYRLPPELLCMIATLARDGLPVSCCPQLILSLSFVSKRFRTILINFPNLWTTWEIGEFSPLPRISFETWMERTGDAPLHLSIYAPSDSVIELLPQAAPRIHTLYLRLHEVNAWPYQLEPLTGLDLPILHTLYIFSEDRYWDGNSYDHHNDTGIPSIPCFNAPSLKKVTTWGPWMNSGNDTVLRYVGIVNLIGHGWIPPLRWIRTLSLMREVKELRLNGQFDFEEGPGFMPLTSTVSLVSLGTLHLDMPDTSLDVIFRCLRLPLLRTLSLNIPSWEDVTSSIVMCGPLFPFLEQTPELERFFIHSLGRSLYKIVYNLGRRMRPTSARPFLPRLSELCILTSFTSGRSLGLDRLHVRTLVEVLQERSNSPSFNFAPLASLRLNETLLENDRAWYHEKIGCLEVVKEKEVPAMFSTDTSWVL